MIKTDEHGDMYIPLPHEAREAIAFELLREDYKNLMHAHYHTTEKLFERPGLRAAQEDYTDQAKYKEAFETLIDYYGGSFNE